MTRYKRGHKDVLSPFSDSVSASSKQQANITPTCVTCLNWTHDASNRTDLSRFTCCKPKPPTLGKLASHRDEANSPQKSSRERVIMYTKSPERCQSLGSALYLLKYLSVLGLHRDTVPYTAYGSVLTGAIRYENNHDPYRKLKPRQSTVQLG